MAKWTFTCRDNGGKFQCLTITATSKQEAILKGIKKAKEKAKGDLSPDWKCTLKSV